MPKSMYFTYLLVFVVYAGWRHERRHYQPVPGVYRYQVHGIQAAILQRRRQQMGTTLLPPTARENRSLLLDRQLQRRQVRCTRTRDVNHDVIQILKTKTKITRPRPRTPEVNKGIWKI